MLIGGSSDSPAVVSFHCRFAELFLFVAQLGRVMC